MSEVNIVNVCIPFSLVAAPTTTAPAPAAAVAGWAVGIPLGDRGSVTTVQSAREVRVRASRESKSSPPSRAKTDPASAGGEGTDLQVLFSKAQ